MNRCVGPTPVSSIALSPACEGTRAPAFLAKTSSCRRWARALISVTGNRDGRPTKTDLALIHILTSKDAVGILPAPWTRDRIGTGKHLGANLLSRYVNQASSSLATSRSPHHLGNADPSIAPHQSSRASDDFLAVACDRNGQFRSRPPNAATSLLMKTAGSSRMPHGSSTGPPCSGLSNASSRPTPPGRRRDAPAQVFRLVRSVPWPTASRWQSSSGSTPLCRRTMTCHARLITLSRIARRP